ncbi:MAG: hypothetical protein II779_12745, partial [Clostridia bacterium]|nr:hypothetical protein [Clostridia bacterium]
LIASLYFFNILLIGTIAHRSSHGMGTPGVDLWSTPKGISGRPLETFGWSSKIGNLRNGNLRVVTPDLETFRDHPRTKPSGWKTFGPISRFDE